MLRNLLISFLVMFGLASGLPASQVALNSWGVNAPVRAILVSGSSVYLGGDFDYAGPYTGGAANLDASSAVLNSLGPRIDGTVYAIISDGAGGWYLGGNFYQAANLNVANLLHLHSDLSVDLNFVARTDASVFALALNGSTLYVGGNFSTVNGLQRTNLAALDSSSGNLLAFTPNPDSYVNALAPAGGLLYVGGNFSNIGGQARHFIAAVDATGTTGWATTFDPSADRAVNQLLLNGSTLYVGGRFQNIGSAARNYLAAIDTTSGLATAWNPAATAGPGNFVSCLAINGSALYVGGLFSVIGGQPRSNLAVLDLSSALATTFTADCDLAVNSFAMSGTTLYLGGDFKSVAGVTRKRLAALDLSVGAPLAWNPLSGGQAWALAAQSGQVYAGGALGSVGGVSREHLAAFDSSSLIPNSFNPGVFGPSPTVNALAISGNTLYVGGAFSSLSATPASNLGQVDLSTGLPLPFGTGADDVVRSLALAGTTLYVAGDFQNAGGQPRSRIAAVDSTSGLATAFNPNADNQVLALLPYGNSVFAGGAFSHIGGQSRANLAALATTTGLASTFNPGSDSSVLGLAMNGSTLYACGNFVAPRTHVMAVDSGSGALSSFNPSTVDGVVNSLLLQNGRLYAAGSFYTFADQYQPNLAAVDPYTGRSVNFFVYTDGPINAMAGDGNTRIYLGGNFSNLQGNWQRNFGVLVDDSGKNIASSGDIVAYPQPARSKICFAFDANGAGQLVVEVYNFAMQHVATFKEQIPASGQHNICEDLGPIVGGAYFYKASLNGFKYPTRKFWVLR